MQQQLKAAGTSMIGSLSQGSPPRAEQRLVALQLPLRARKCSTGRARGYWSTTGMVGCRYARPGVHIFRIWRHPPKISPGRGGRGGFSTWFDLGGHDNRHQFPADQMLCRGAREHEGAVSHFFAYSRETAPLVARKVLCAPVSKACAKAPCEKAFKHSKHVPLAMLVSRLTGWNCNSPFTCNHRLALA